MAGFFRDLSKAGSIRLSQIHKGCLLQLVTFPLQPLTSASICQGIIHFKAIAALKIFVFRCMLFLKIILITHPSLKVILLLFYVYSKIYDFYEYPCFNLPLHYSFCSLTLLPPHPHYIALYSFPSSAVFPRGGAVGLG